MIRATPIRHTLSALATAAFSLTLIGQAWAGDRQQTPKLHPSQLQWAATINAAKVKPSFPKGLATKKQRTQNRDDLKSGYIGTDELGHTAKKEKGLATNKGRQAGGGISYDEFSNGLFDVGLW